MVEANDAAAAKFAAIGITGDTLTNLLKNKKVVASLMEVLSVGEISECPKEQGSLYYALATKLKPNHQKWKVDFAAQIK